MLPSVAHPPANETVPLNRNIIADALQLAAAQAQAQARSGGTHGQTLAMSGPGPRTPAQPGSEPLFPHPADPGPRVSQVNLPPYVPSATSANVTASQQVVTPRRRSAAPLVLVLLLLVLGGVLFVLVRSGVVRTGSLPAAREATPSLRA